MSIKPWLSKNFLQMMSWSNVRDYPPKRKKPWLFDNFMEMEEIHSDHMEEPWNDPILPLPPSPGIPQDPEPDPCAGPRSLWVLVSPTGGVDCDTPGGFTLIISPDFKCVSIQQIFIFDGPVLTDSLGRPLIGPVNAKDIVGGLEIAKGCDDPPWITLAICDCLCGGCSYITVRTENCGAACGEVSVEGEDSIGNGSSEQYSLSGYAGTVEWSITPESEGVSISGSGLLTTTSPECGNVTVIATTSCCDTKSKGVTILGNGGSYSDLISDTSYGASGVINCVNNDGEDDYQCDSIDGTTLTRYNGKYACRSSDFFPDLPGEAPCSSGDPNESPACGHRPVPFEICNRIAYITRIRIYEWVC